MKEMYNVAMELYTNYPLVYYYIVFIGGISGIMIWEGAPIIVKEFLRWVKTIRK